MERRIQWGITSSCVLLAILYCGGFGNLFTFDKQKYFQGKKNSMPSICILLIVPHCRVLTLIVHYFMFLFSPTLWCSHTHIYIFILTKTYFQWNKNMMLIVGVVPLIRHNLCSPPPPLWFLWFLQKIHFQGKEHNAPSGTLAFDQLFVFSLLSPTLGFSPCIFSRQEQCDARSGTCTFDQPFMISLLSPLSITWEGFALPMNVRGCQGRHLLRWTFKMKNVT